MTTKTAIPSKQVQNALRLAYIKLIDSHGFDNVDGTVNPDPQAKKQILEAILSFDPEFAPEFPEEREWKLYLPLTQREQAVVLRSLAVANACERTSEADKEVNTWLVHRMMRLQTMQED